MGGLKDKQDTFGNYSAVVFMSGPLSLDPKMGGINTHMSYLLSSEASFI